HGAQRGGLDAEPGALRAPLPLPHRPPGRPSTARRDRQGAPAPASSGGADTGRGEPLDGGSQRNAPARGKPAIRRGAPPPRMPPNAGKGHRLRASRADGPGTERRPRQSRDSPRGGSTEYSASPA